MRSFGMVFTDFEARIDPMMIDLIVRDRYSDVERIRLGLLVRITRIKRFRITWEENTYPLKIRIRDHPLTVQELAYFVEPLAIRIVYEWKYRRNMRKEINKLKDEILAKETNVAVAIEE